MKPVDLSIVIVSYNVNCLVQQCIESILNQETPYIYEIWVVDNYSNDQTARTIADKYPEVRLITNKENVGFAAANNQAIRKANGKYIWLLNPDTKLNENAISPLIEAFERNQDVAVTGSLLANPDGSLQRSCYPFPTLSNEIFRLFHLEQFRKDRYDMRTWGQNQTREIEVNQGASFMIRKTALDQVGLLDERFYIYTEEVDLCYRLHQAGWKILWQPLSQVIHFGGQSTQQNRLPMFLELYRTKILFFRKHYGPVKAYMYKMILFLVAVSRIVVGFFGFIKNRKKNLMNNYFQLIKSLPAF